MKSFIQVLCRVLFEENAWKLLIVSTSLAVLLFCDTTYVEEFSDWSPVHAHSRTDVRIKALKALAAACLKM